MNQEVLARINDNGLFKGLRVHTLETQLGNTQSLPKKKKKLRVLTVKSAFLSRISPAFSASGLV